MNRRSFLGRNGAFPLFLGLSRQDRDFDLIVRGGSLLDGSGAPAERKDVEIRGEVGASGKGDSQEPGPRLELSPAAV